MGQAVRLSQFGSGVQPEMELDYKKVLEALAESRSMPFLELTVVCDIGNDRLKSIINVLESQDKVKVTNRDNILEEIVSLKKKP